MKKDVMQRFEEEIDRNDPIIRLELGHCHTWLGKRSGGRLRSKYGMFYFAGRWAGAHHWIFEQVYGPAAKRALCAIPLQSVVPILCPSSTKNHQRAPTSTNSKTRIFSELC
jgi:hypothetical protein